MASRRSVVTPAEEDTRELSSDDIGKMKRRIADVLEPGETVSFHFSKFQIKATELISLCFFLS